MTSIDSTHPANAGIDAAAAVRDASASVRQSRFVRVVMRCVARLLRTLHESRSLESERVLARYRHLIGESDDQAERSHSGD
jgi:hypothetical protein